MSGQRWQPSETEFTMLLFKALPDQVRYRASSGHPGAKAGVILFPPCICRIKLSTCAARSG
jgi:hypothetical protein